MKIIKTNILNPVSQDYTDLLKDTYLFIEQNKIKLVTDVLESTHIEIEDKTDCICLPGFIDTHVHLSQFRIRGKHSPNLLHWLNTYTFQEELRSKDEKYAREIAHEFFIDLRKKGTTTAVIYTAPFKKACDIAFEVAQEMGFHGFIGMTMMDQNSPEYLLQNTKQAFEDSVNLYEKWNSGKLEYIFTPRFAPTCTRDLMQQVGEFAHQNSAFIQTHLSENSDEIKWVLELFPECKSYTDVYQRYNILGEKTILGHCIHLVDEELELIKNSKSKIAHCPDSNFFLKSGSFPFEKLQQLDIDFALASDVGGGTTLSMLEVMKMANYRQDSYIVSPESAFYYATLGGAKLLGREVYTGSIEPGKDADLNFIPYSKEMDKKNILSDLLYLGNELKIEPFEE